MPMEAVILPPLRTGARVPIRISHWFASRGDKIREGDQLVEVVAGAATLRVAAPRDGVVARLMALEDDPVAPGAVLAWIKVRPDKTRPRNHAPQPQPRRDPDPDPDPAPESEPGEGPRA